MVKSAPHKLVDDFSCLHKVLFNNQNLYIFDQCKKIIIRKHIRNLFTQETDQLVATADKLQKLEFVDTISSGSNPIALKLRWGDTQTVYLFEKSIVINQGSGFIGQIVDFMFAHKIIM